MRIKFMRMTPIEKVEQTIVKEVPEDITFHDVVDSVQVVFDQNTNQVTSAGTSIINDVVFVAIMTRDKNIFKMFIRQVLIDLLSSE